MSFLVTTPEPMLRMRLLVPRDRTVEALTALQRIGVLHPERSTALEGEHVAIERERNAVNGLIGDIDDALEDVSENDLVPISADTEAYLTRPASEIADQTRRLCRKIQAMRHRAERLERQQAHWHELGRVARSMSDRPGLSSGDFGFTGRHVYSRLTLWPREEFDDIADQVDALSLKLEVFRGEELAAAFVVGGIDQLEELEDLVAHHGHFLEAPVAEDLSMAELAARAESELKRLAARREGVRAELDALIRAELEELLLLREALKAERERLELIALAAASRHVALIEGWVPESRAEDAAAALREALGAVFVEAVPAEAGATPPSRLRNPAAVRPFEVIVSLFSTPRYGGWDPTPVVAASFALFFGLMLGDAIYGALLMALVVFALPKLVDDPEAEGFVAFRRLLAICAGGAILMGVLQGAWLGDFPQHFFGMPDLALSQTLKGFYLEPMVFIVFSLVVGLVHVNLGHLLMLIRGLRERRADAIVGRSALFVLQLSALPWILRILGVNLPGLDDEVYTALLWAMAASLVLIIVASLMERGPFLGGILWVFDVSGILGDVMSYARLAGVGLATYFLAYSFNMMATLVAGMFPEGVVGLVLGGLVMLVILVFGHLLNLLLSSITCFVHALRLCFVEFMFKFYEGGGRPYAPFRLNRRTRLPLRTGGAEV